MRVSVINQLSLVLVFFGVNAACAQNKTDYDSERIEDNSFLIEEAYNQDPGVIQHISTFQYMNDRTWTYTFTDEWPVGGMKHQLSTTIPVMNAGFAGFGDVELNYRYQAVYTSRLAFSPRFSLVLPTGNYKKGFGNGAVGYQISLPMSFITSRKLVTHYNLGATFTPGAKAADQTTSDIRTVNYGASAILLVSPTFNFMLEAAGNTTNVKMDGVSTSGGNFLLINPGFRYAINFKSGLQIVPGISVPIGLDAAKDRVRVFAYLSFEHPLKRISRIKTN